MTDTDGQASEVRPVLDSLIAELIGLGHSYEAASKGRCLLSTEGDHYRSMAAGIDIALATIRRRLK